MRALHKISDSRKEEKNDFRKAPEHVLYVCARKFRFGILRMVSAVTKCSPRIAAFVAALPGGSYKAIVFMSKNVDRSRALRQPRCC